MYIRFSGTTQTIVTAGEDIECTFLIRNIRMFSAEALERGGPVYDKTSKEYLGEITNVRIDEGEYQVNMADGSFKAVAPEERYNAYVTVEFEGKVGENGYYTAANKYLAAGTTVVINTKYAQCESTVYSIKEK
ncbi:MAG: DUF4330 domain-containing protein [Clostridia bacterium]|nr:DUF4330 domain-containing protein [Clostridia bacterium]